MLSSPTWMAQIPIPGRVGYAYRKKAIVVFRTDFRVDHKILGDLPGLAEHDRAPYNLMLTESATKRLDLPFIAVDSVADRIA
jgi:hypothetical protein